MKYFLIQDTYFIDGKTHIGYGIGYIEDSSTSFKDLTVNQGECRICISCDVYGKGKVIGFI